MGSLQRLKDSIQAPKSQTELCITIVCFYSPKLVNQWLQTSLIYPALLLSKVYLFLFPQIYRYGEYEVCNGIRKCIVLLAVAKEIAVRWSHKAEYLLDSSWDPHSHLQPLKKMYVCV